MPVFVTVKSNGSSVTVRLKEVVFDFPPPVPVTTRGNVPAGVEVPVVTVRVEEQVGLQDSIEKAALAPLGSPVTEKATG